MKRDLVVGYLNIAQETVLDQRARASCSCQSIPSSKFCFGSCIAPKQLTSDRPDATSKFMASQNHDAVTNRLFGGDEDQPEVL
jgi:hypothetical protein